MSSFRETRNVELSTHDHIKTIVQAAWSGITVVLGFANAYKASLPVISVEVPEEYDSFEEVGSTNTSTEYILSINIHATSNGQKNDIADFLKDSLKSGWIYYEFSQTSGSPEVTTKTAVGRMHIVQYLINKKVDFGDSNADKYEKHRHVIELKIAIE